MKTKLWVLLLPAVTILAGIALFAAGVDPTIAFVVGSAILGYKTRMAIAG